MIPCLKIYLKKKSVCFLPIVVIFIGIFTGIVLCYSTNFYAIKNTETQNKCDNEASPIALPVIMYHSVEKIVKKKNKFVISAKTFESDLEYLKNNGFTTIFVEDLINFVNNGAKLPEKPIILTFDDGFYNNYLYCFPLAKKFNTKIVISPIMREVERYSGIDDTNPYYAYLSSKNIKEMSDSGLVEFQNHTFNLHGTRNRTGVKKNNFENLESYKKIITNDLTKSQNMLADITGKRPTAFVYPFGAISKETPKIIKSLGFKASFNCENKVNFLTGNPEELYNLCRFIRTDSLSSDAFFGKISRKCITNNSNA